MTKLFERDIKVQAGELEISPRTASGADQPVLKMVFSIEKTLTKEPNKAELTIWNLKEDSRKKLTEKNIAVRIEAGYVDDRPTLFFGTMDFGATQREATEWITKLEAGDGSRQFRTSRINVSLKGPIGVGAILKTIADQLGLDPGNLRDKIASNGGRNIFKQVVSGKMLSGKTIDVLEEIAQSAGLQVSIQNGRLQFLSPSETNKDTIVVLNAGSGLVGSPEVGEKGFIKARTLLNGRIAPGGRVRVEAAVINGDYRVEKVVHKGDTWGNDWYSEIEAKPL